MSLTTVSATAGEYPIMILPRYCSGIMILPQYEGDVMGDELVLCTACKVEKPVSEMAKDRRRVKGYIPKCTACKTLSGLAYRHRHRQLTRERSRERYLRDSRRRAEDRRQYTKNHPEQTKARMRAERVSEKGQARNALREAVRSGRVMKPDACQDCGRSGVKIDGHHHDYTKPFDVEWLCSWCHGKRHRLPDVEMAG